MNALQPLPKIVRFLDTTDAGEFGAAACPHCGAAGRYVLHFVLEGGQQAGAMRGCVRLFPVSPVAREELRLRQKEKDYAKKGWRLNEGDGRALQAIEDFYAGQISEESALQAVQWAKLANVARFRSNR